MDDHSDRKTKTNALHRLADNCENQPMLPRNQNEVNTSFDFIDLSLI